MTATELVLAATGVEFAFERCAAGMHGLRECGAELPEETVSSIRRTGVALKGPLTNDPTAERPGQPSSRELAVGFSTAMIALRHHLDIHANLRWARLPLPAGTGDEIDIWVVRDVTEDTYGGQEILINDGNAVLVKKTTHAASARIARTAFEFARANGRRKITAVHKAEVLPITDGIFRDAVRGVASTFPDIKFDEMAPDAAALHLVREPQRFDVLLTQFFAGDVFSDLCAGLIGGIGLVSGVSLGGEAAIFEAAHGSAPKYTGLDQINPCGLILSAALMLAHVGEQDASDRIIDAVASVVREGQDVTSDLGGTAGTMAMAKAVARYVQSPSSASDRRGPRELSTMPEDGTNLRRSGGGRGE
jgi:isocitrate dehydrogenase (NAD+)